MSSALNLYRFQPQYMKLFKSCNEIPGECVLGTDDYNMYGMNEDEEDIQLWKYNFASEEYQQIHVDNAPYCLARRTTLISGRYLIVFGGHAEIGTEDFFNNDLYFCNLSKVNTTFKFIETHGKKPPKRSNQAIFFYDNFLYTIGGLGSDGSKMDVHRMEVETKKWEEIYICEGTKSYPSCFFESRPLVIGNKVFLIGGFDRIQNKSLEVLTVFDLMLNVYEQVKTKPDLLYGYPNPRFSHLVYNNCTEKNDEFIVLGGKIENSQQVDEWKFDLSTCSWTKLLFENNDIPICNSNTIVKTNGQIYTLHEDTRKRKRTRKRTRIPHYSIYTSSLTIPKLKDIAFDAYTRYGKMYHNTPQELKDGYNIQAFTMRFD